MQLLGYPMCGSLSEPATVCDSSTNVNKLHECAQTQRRFNLDCDGLPAEQVLAGMQHVDDVLVISWILWLGCIRRLLSRLFPRDLALEEEESSRGLQRRPASTI